MKPVCLVRGQHYRPKIEQHTVWIEFTPRVKPILDLPQEDVRYLLDVMWGTDMFVRHVNKDGSVNTDKFGYIFKNRLSGRISNSSVEICGRSDTGQNYLETLHKQFLMNPIRNEPSG